MTDKKTNLAALASWLATRDWLKEFSLSFCGVLALASMLAPLLVLHGVHMGVVERLRENLLSDPAVLVVIPSGSRGSGFEKEFLDEISKTPGVRFVIGRTRDVASELQLESSADKRLTITLEATEKGDPLFENEPLPLSAQKHLEITLSATAARKLDVKAGDIVKSVLTRRLSSGRFQRHSLDWIVKSVLPPNASGQDTGFVDPDTLFAIQDFRDGISSALLDVKGEKESEGERRYESFRAYATDLDAVGEIEKWFLAKDIQVKTRARDIANIKKIDSTLASVIALIAFAGCAGFFAFMASTAQAAVRRKWKQMGMLKLIGFSKTAILVFPLVQALLTGIFGCLLAFCMYGGVAISIDALFSEETGGQAICVIAFGFFCLVFAAVLSMAIVASLPAAIKASSISPATVIRDS